VKLFQAISLNNNLIDERINNKLLQFTDNAPWTYEDIRLDELIEVCDDYDIILDNGYETPVNSGMISLVFRGHKRETQEKVVIKMKRKNIDEKLRGGIEQLQTFLNILSFIPIIHKLKIVDIVNKNIDIIIDQTNFEREVENTVTIQNNCSKLKYIIVPQVKPQVTQKYNNFIMMNYIEGKKINEIQENETDFLEFSKIIIKFGVVTSLMHGITHGDLHSGNILFIKDEIIDEKNEKENEEGKERKERKYRYKIGVLDFGIVYNFNSQYKGVLFDCLINIFNKSAVDSATQLLKVGFIDPPNFWQNISEEEFDNLVLLTSKLIEETKDKTKRIHLLQFIFKIKDFLNTLEIQSMGIKPSDDFIKIQLVLAMAQGVISKLCVWNFMELAEQVINELFHVNLLM
jgi:predicted unusual protein kinase regulating ubiquinone biosynthesis (AarF/ABC1/UbiB family)